MRFGSDKMGVWDKIEFRCAIELSMFRVRKIFTLHWSDIFWDGFTSYVDGYGLY